MQEIEHDKNSSTKVVSEFYNAFPFPSQKASELLESSFDWRLSLEDVFAFCEGVLGYPIKIDPNINILDAGCGTGLSTHSLASLNEFSEILAIDISESSLEIAKKRILTSKIKNKSKVKFRQINLLDLNVENSFDFINSIGVLQHLDNPFSGINALARALKQDGILRLFLYSESGRREINRLRRVFQLMSIDERSDYLFFAQKIILGLEDSNPLKIDFLRNFSHTSFSEVDFADMYLHPFEKSFDLAQLFDLIDSSGLEFVSFLNPKEWSLERLLNDESLSLARALPLRTQLHIIENLNTKPSHFDFFLIKKDSD